VLPSALFDRRPLAAADVVNRHATRSGDRPMFEPDDAGELGQALAGAEGSVTGGRRGTAIE
jgi:hypothetical protein